MPKTREQKQEVVQKFSDQLQKQNAMVFVDVKGLNVKALASLRSKLKALGSQITVIKKTLFQRALQEKGLVIDTKKLEGQVGVVFAFQDPVEPFRTAYGFGKGQEHFKILGGYFEQEFRSPETVKEIAQLPSREQLLGRMVGAIQSPLQGFRSVLEGNIKGLLSVLAQAKTS
ncbi:MAG: 50S ribosomal protein L10 [bacterium]|nr:50S ribosomal protein L10 [bacterium]